jgi:hypothetical protein
MRDPTGAVVVGEMAWAFLDVHKRAPSGQSPAFPRFACYGVADHSGAGGVAGQVDAE